MPRRILSFLGLGLGKVMTPKLNAHISDFYLLPDCDVAHSSSEPMTGLLSLLTNSLAFYYKKLQWQHHDTDFVLWTQGMHGIS